MGERGGRIRVGTDERERALRALADHFAAGRLEVAEYEQRCGAATTARTRADLVEVFDDLPAPHPDFGAAPPPAPVAHESPLVESPGSSSTKVVIGTFVGIAALALVAVVAITGTWWLLAPLLLIGLFLVMMS